MSDIVERLRGGCCNNDTHCYRIRSESAGEIERLWKKVLHWEHQNSLLEAENERLRAALKLDGASRE